MMRIFRVIFIFFIFSSLACVSIDIPKNELKRSNTYSFKKPNSKLFTLKETPELDKLWVHERNGNSISILSDCSSNYDPSLDQIKNGITTGINNLETKSSKYQTYNKRKALFAHIVGDVDGVLSEFDLVIFKKDGCVYTLTHVATKNSYKATKEIFDDFVLNFKVD